MDDLINEFLVETNESLEQLDQDFVILEQNPQDSEIIGNIFRVMHTIKGTCGFLGLSRLEHVAHAAENIMDTIRDGDLAVTPEVISIIFEATDLIKDIVSHIEETGEEDQGDDGELVERLNNCAEGKDSSAGSKNNTSNEEVESAKTDTPKTADLDEEIDFEPIVADYAGDEAKENISKTADLDEEIDFEPIAADYAGEGEAKKDEKSDNLPATKEVSNQQKEKALDAGLKAASSSKKPASQSIRVDLDLLDNLMQMVGELVLTRNQMLQISKNHNSNDKSTVFESAMQRLNLVTSELQDATLKTRMQPIGNAWSKFPRLIRDLSLDLEKKIELKMIGADTDLDRQMLESIKDPLTHMVRNSADHGLEKPEARLAAGKSETGTITLSAHHDSGHVVIKISDNGAGLNKKRISEKVIENGLATAEELESITDKQLYQFIFKAGFSTAEAITAVSGRGVGMDVVISNIKKIGGHVEVNSIEGKGSDFIIKLPLTLAIMPVLIVHASNQTFAIPQIRVSEIVKVGSNNNGESESQSTKIETINDAPIMRLRGSLLPLISVSESLKLDAATTETSDKKEDINDIENSFVVVCEVGSRNIGLIVDRVAHTEEIVVKPIASCLKHIEAFMGCTILGDGKVIMIIDPAGIMTKSGAYDLASQTVEEEEEEEESYLDKNISMLMFKAWDKSPFIVPLELVSRLEKVDMSKAEWAGEQRVVQYREGLMNLISLNDGTTLPDSGICEVVVFADDARTIGIVVEEIIDIVKTPVDVQTQTKHDGTLGSIIVNSQTAEMIDISYYFEKIFSDWLTIHGVSSETENTTAKGRALLVDDSPFFRRFMTPVLGVANFDVITAEDPLKALEILDKDHNFDIIVTDIDMPHMNGIEFTKKCKEQEWMQNIPFIALTSHNKDELLSKHDDPGFSGFVTKSDRDSLVNVMIESLSVNNKNEEVDS